MTSLMHALPGHLGHNKTPLRQGSQQTLQNAFRYPTFHQTHRKPQLKPEVRRDMLPVASHDIVMGVHDLRPILKWSHAPLFLLERRASHCRAHSRMASMRTSVLGPARSRPRCAPGASHFLLPRTPNRRSDTRIAIRPAHAADREPQCTGEESAAADGTCFLLHHCMAWMLSPTQPTPHYGRCGATNAVEAIERLVGWQSWLSFGPRLATATVRPLFLRCALAGAVAGIAANRPQTAAQCAMGDDGASAVSPVYAMLGRAHSRGVPLSARAGAIAYSFSQFLSHGARAKWATT
ncbi:hypothetical protein FB451DRAFT_1362735 [Mycena latifolia]|nr:hypothetical protein FB451DRAFT_1362735 [Mycena latifolia]